MARVHIKSFIQPFEYKLALMELKNLLKLSNNKEVSPDRAGNVLIRISAKDLQILRNRLAYIDLLESDSTEITLQTSLESSYMNGKDGALPKRRILRYGPHGLHEYRGKFFPQMVRALINISGNASGSKVLDPMCGSGTTSVVAKEMGLKTYGLDINPLSVELTLAKTDLLDFSVDSLEQLQARILERIYGSKEQKESHPKHDLLASWFHHNALSEMQIIISAIEAEKDTKQRRFLNICLSNIIREISWQKTDDLRIRKEIYDYKPGAAQDLFVRMLKKNVANGASYIGALRSHTRIKYKPADIRLGDARKISQSLPRLVGKTDIIITSPPYATALPYLDTDRLSLSVLNLLTTKSHKDIDLQMIGNREINKKVKNDLWMNYNSNKSMLTKDINRLISHIEEGNTSDPTAGFRKKNLPPLLAKYFMDMHQVLVESLKVCKDGADAFFIVGSNSTTVLGQKITIETDSLLWQLAKKVGWKHAEFIPMELLHSRDIFKENRGTTETILWLKK